MIDTSFVVPPAIPAMQSSSIGKLTEALAKAQGEMEGAKKGKENPFFHSNYPGLDDVCKASLPYLSKNNLAIIQTLESEDGGVVVVTTLAHSSGEWIRGRLLIKPTKADAQGIGSVITYGRRYSHMAIIGLPAEDDDGEAGVGREPKTSKPMKPVTKSREKSGQPMPPSLKQKEFIRKRKSITNDMLDEIGNIDEIKTTIASCLGDYKPSSEWTNDDCIKLQEWGYGSEEDRSVVGETDQAGTSDDERSSDN